MLRNLLNDLPENIKKSLPLYKPPVRSGLPLPALPILTDESGKDVQNLEMGQSSGVPVDGLVVVVVAISATGVVLATNCDVVVVTDSHPAITFCRGIKLDH